VPTAEEQRQRYDHFYGAQATRMLSTDSSKMLNIVDEVRTPAATHLKHVFQVPMGEIECACAISTDVKVITDPLLLPLFAHPDLPFMPTNSTASGDRHAQQPPLV
jgi:hypothetical protein